MMNVSDFVIGKSFFMRGIYPETREIRCTDIGTRTVVGVRIEDVCMVKYSNGQETREIIPKAEADAQGLFRPMFGCVEEVFDQDDMDVCYPTHEECLANMTSPDEDDEFTPG